MMIRWRLLFCTFAIALAVSTIGMVVGQAGEPVPLAPHVSAAAELGPVPDDCGILAESMPIDPMIPQAIGAWPVWYALPNEGSEMLGILDIPNRHYHTHPQLDGWWTNKAAWFVLTSYPGVVEISGYNIEDESPIFFDISHDGLSEVTTLDPAQPAAEASELDDRWAFFPGYAWVSKAGCYRIRAEWDGGLWEQVIAVGDAE